MLGRSSTQVEWKTNCVVLNNEAIDQQFRIAHLNVIGDREYRFNSTALHKLDTWSWSLGIQIDGVPGRVGNNGRCTLTVGGKNSSRFSSRRRRLRQSDAATDGDIERIGGQNELRRKNTPVFDGLDHIENLNKIAEVAWTAHRHGQT